MQLLIKGVRRASRVANEAMAGFTFPVGVEGAALLGI